MKTKSREFDLQQAIMRWAALLSGAWPELRLLYHCPNGGSRNPIEAANLKRLGVRAGVPDLHLPIARGGYHGLWIELKSRSGRIRPEQIQWQQILRIHGHRVEIVRSVEEAIRVIQEYLNLARNPC
jgi:hypothetical protein